MTPRRSAISAERRNSATSAVTAVRFLIRVSARIAVLRSDKSRRRVLSAETNIIQMPVRIADTTVRFKTRIRRQPHFRHQLQLIALITTGTIKARPQ